MSCRTSFRLREAGVEKRLERRRRFPRRTVGCILRELVHEREVKILHAHAPCDGRLDAPVIRRTVERPNRCVEVGVERRSNEPVQPRVGRDHRARRRARVRTRKTVP